MSNLYQRDANRKFTYQDSHPEIRAIRTKLKQEYHKLGFRQLSRELGGVLSPGQINNFFYGCGVQDDALEVIKKYIDWKPADIDAYLEIYRQEKSSQKNQGYIPVPPEGELEVLEKDWNRWEKVFNGEHPYS